MSWASLAESPLKASRNLLVPERAIVPRLSITSSSLMPMPLSLMVKVRAAAVRDQGHGQGVRAHQRRIGKRFEAQLLAGIGGVRDQLAQENLLVRIQRMDHQVAALAWFRIETL